MIVRPSSASAQAVLVDLESHAEVLDGVGFRLSVGAGVRISIPQVLGPVPLAFDFGFPIMKERFDDERVFNFYVGFTR